MLSDIPNVIVHIDDILIYSKTVDEHNKVLRVVLQRLKKEGVTLNKQKCIFGAKEIQFLSHRISEHGINILPERVSAIANFPTPKNKESLLHFLGIINYVGKFIPNKSYVLEPLNALLKSDVAFVWLEPQEQAFDKKKQLVQKAPTLAHYDYSKNIIVQADACTYGLGGVLIQEDNGREVVAYASRTLNDSEKKYSQIEKEALALAFATERFKEYITGINITLETDHQPLVQVLQTNELTPRLQRIRMRLMRYNYKVVYIPGKQLVLADSLSRNPLSRSESKGDDLPKEIETYIRFIVNSFPASQNLLGRIRSEQESDYACSKLKDYCLTKWPSKNRLHDGLLPYFQHKDNISFTEGFLLYNSRLIIPPPLQLELLGKIHEGHFGINKCRDRAKQAVWWLGLSSQLTNLVENCPNCIEERQNIREPFVKQDFPDRPWQKIAIDLCKTEKWFLIITDYYSRFLEICPLKSLTESEIINHCKIVFSRFGIPEVVRSDCGTQFSTEFRRFANDYDFKHITSSPKFSQSNGAVEAAVKVAKRILKKCDDINLGLLAYRTTPLENDFSPSELLFSRKIRSRVPVLPRNLGTFVKHDQLASKENKRKEVQEHMYNKRHRVKNLSILQAGDKVWVIDMRVYGKILNADENPNSYIVKTENGSTIRRNRWHLVLAPLKQSLNIDNTDAPIIPEFPQNNIPAIAPENADHRNYVQHNDIPPINGEIEKALPIVDELRKSSRQRKPPARLDDYICEK